MEGLAVFLILVAAVGALAALVYGRRAARLRSEAEMLRAVAANLDEGVLVTDARGAFLLCNAAAERVLGARIQPLDPADWPQKFGVVDADTLLPFPVEKLPLVRALRGESTEPVELRMINSRVPDGVVLSVTARPLREGALLVFHDVTERKRTEQELKRAHGKLSASLDEIRVHDAQMTLLNEMTEKLQSCQSLDEACAAIGHSAKRLFPGDSGSVCLLNPARTVVEAAATWGDAPGERVFAPEECWALRRGKPHFIGGETSDLICKHVAGLDSSGCVPMVAQGETLGIVHLRLAAEGRFDPSLRLVTSTFAEEVALAVGNLKLRESLRSQAIRDPLTGLFNRRFMEESLERELRRAARKQLVLSVVMLDLDHFKRFNDQHGHPAGDAILKCFGEVLASSVRAEDVVCRYGGEEFVVILPESSLEDTSRRVDQIRERVRAIRVEYRGSMLGPLSTSSGIAVYPQHGSSVEGLLRAADEALLSAKAAGRDRVQAAKPLRHSLTS